VGSTTLQELFSRLHSTCSNNDFFIWQARERSENSGWTVEWRRNLFEWEQIKTLANANSGGSKGKG